MLNLNFRLMLRWSNAGVVLGLLVLTSLMAAPSHLVAQINEQPPYGVYPELIPVPSLPVAGSKVVDPRFGTTILRLTDGPNGTPGNTGAGSMYSYWPAFNSDNSYVVVREDFATGGPRARFFSFNPVTFTANNSFGLTNPPVGQQWGIQQHSLMWSGSNPAVTYGITDRGLYSITINSSTSQTYLLLRDFGTPPVSLPSQWKVTQPSKSLNDDIFAMSIVDGSNVVKGYLVWKRSTNQILRITDSTPNIDEVHVDKSGRWLVVDFTNQSNEIWDLSSLPQPTKNPTCCISGYPGFVHYGLGQGTAFTGLFSPSVPRSLGYRSLSTPATIIPLLPPNMWSYEFQQDHFSLLGNDEQWGLASRYSFIGGSVEKPFDNEILLVATDGSQRVRRLAHNRSLIVGLNSEYSYAAAPKASISRDGMFVLFTSNWGIQNGRIDAYIVRTSVPTRRVLASDAFLRSNSTDLGSNWTPVTGSSPLQLVSNAIQASSPNQDAGEFYTGINLPADQWAQQMISTFSGTAASQSGVFLRGNGNTYYLFFANKNFGGGITSYILKSVNGVETILAQSSAVAWVNGDVHRAEAVGNTLSLYRNNVLVVSVTDGAIPSGSRAGMFLFTGGTLSNNIADTWSAGDFDTTRQTLGSDDFLRVNSVDLGSNWTPVTGWSPLTLVSNAVQASSLNQSTGEFYTGVSLPANQWAQQTISTFSGTAVGQSGLLLRGNGTNTYYLFFANKNFGTTTSYILKSVNGVETILAQNSVATWANGDVIRAQAVGNTLSLYRNNVLVVSVTDGNSPIPSGPRAGVFLYTAGTTLNTNIANTWSAGGF